MNPHKLKILIYDIETSPMLGYLWKLWDQCISPEQVEEESYIMSFAAKWLGDSPKNVIYYDQSKEKNLEDDTKIMKKIWDLLNEADGVITHNGKKFDEKYLNDRFFHLGLPPPKKLMHIDTLKISRKHFRFPSNKLDYLTKKFNKKYKKYGHTEYPGMELWKACMRRDRKAWKIMKKYNILDVLSLEEFYVKIQPWDNSTSFAAMSGIDACNCGSTRLEKMGFRITSQGTYQRYRCKECGATHSAKKAIKQVKKASIKPD